MLTYELKKAPGLPLYEDLYRKIRQDILDGTLKPGEKLPSKRALAEHLELGKITVEAAYYRRGKNSHVHAVPKGATPAQYAKATGLETLFGALYLAGQTERLNELFHAAVAEE